MSFDSVLARYRRRVCIGCGCACNAAHVGALERTNPLPLGRYWVDVFAPDSAAFSEWLVRNGRAVRVVTTEHFQANAGGPARDWILFDVTSPTLWEGPGLPTIAVPSVTSSSDTAVRPPPEPDITTTLEQGLQVLGSSTRTAVGAVLVLGALVLFMKGARR